MSADGTVKLSQSRGRRLSRRPGRSREAGVIDPVKVVRVELENAVSVASQLLLTEATMTDLSEPKPERTAAEDLV